MQSNEYLCTRRISSNVLPFLECSTISVKISQFPCSSRTFVRAFARESKEHVFNWYVLPKLSTGCSGLYTICQSALVDNSRVNCQIIYTNLSHKMILLYHKFVQTARLSRRVYCILWIVKILTNAPGIWVVKILTKYFVIFLTNGRSRHVLKF